MHSYNQQYIYVRVPNAAQTAHVLTVGDGWGIGMERKGYDSAASDGVQDLNDEVEVLSVAWQFNPIVEQDTAYIT